MAKITNDLKRMQRISLVISRALERCFSSAKQRQWTCGSSRTEKKKVTRGVKANKSIGHRNKGEQKKWASRKENMATEHSRYKTKHEGEEKRETHEKKRHNHKKHESNNHKNNPNT